MAMDLSSYRLHHVQPITNDFKIKHDADSVRLQCYAHVFGFDENRLQSDDVVIFVEAEDYVHCFLIGL